MICLSTESLTYKFVVLWKILIYDLSSDKQSFDKQSLFKLLFSELLWNNEKEMKQQQQQKQHEWFWAEDSNIYIDLIWSVYNISAMCSF